MSNAYNNTLDFASPKPARTAAVWAGIVNTFAAIREGIDLAGEYKELTNRGMASDEAARKVFDKIGRN